MSAAEYPFDLSDARWLAHRIDLSTDEIVFRWTPRPQHAAAPFLTDTELGVDAPLHRMAREQAMAQLSPTAPLHLIAHSAFCNSTLLTRAMDHPGIAMGLSEPMILNDLVGFRRRGEVDMRTLAALSDGALGLLARPWHDDGRTEQAVIVKPSNIINPLLPGLMTLRPAMKLLILHAPLETFLISVAHKGLWCRLWVRELLEGLRHDGAVDLGFSESDFFRQSDLQIAAIGWLAQHRLFHAVIARFGDRVRTLDSDRMLANRDQTMAALAAHFGLALSDDRITAMANGPAFTRHSKSGAAFSATDRQAGHAATRAAHADEIDKVLVWAQAVADANGIALTLPAPLID